MRDNPDKRIKALRRLFISPLSGGVPDFNGDRFYVLGLSPNMGRLSVRFWLPTTVNIIQENLKKWFNEIYLVGGTTDYPPLRDLLSSLSSEHKPGNLSPLLEGAVIESIFNGTNFPETLLATALQRMRAERCLRYLRTALIKAVLVRNYRKAISVKLDINNPEPSYQLGRLFAIFEKTQEKASPNINSTIRDRYFSAASTRPMTAFPMLHKLHVHHLRKIKVRRHAESLERWMSEIIKKLSGPYPSILNMQEQGLFSIGYYHQKQAFFEMLWSLEPTATKESEDQSV